MDTYRAQHIRGGNKMTGFFAVSGLYLYLDGGYTGRQARQAHVAMAQHKDFPWPAYQQPEKNNWLTVADVLAAATGAERDNMIHQWAESVWKAWQHDRANIAAICAQVL